MVAGNIYKTLSRNGELELIQGLDASGQAHLLVQVTAIEASRLGIGTETIMSAEDLGRKYEALSSITFQTPNALQKKMEKMARKQQLQGNGPGEASNNGFHRCEYERGRLYKRIVMDRLDCTKFNMPSDPKTLQALSNTRVVALSLTPWGADRSAHSKNTILDVGVAFAQVQTGSDGVQGLAPTPDATRRVKNKINANKKRNDAKEMTPYPQDEAQTQSIDEHLVGRRIEEILSSASESDGKPNQSVILLVNDESWTKAVLKTKFGMDVDGWKGGLKDLFQSITGTETRSSRSQSQSQRYATPSSSSASRPRRSRSRSRSSPPLPRERDYHYPSSSSSSSFYVVDVKAVYERVSKTYDHSDGWYIPGMASKVGLQLSPQMVWNAGVYAELLIEIFNRLIHGKSIDEEDALYAQSLPQPSSVLPISMSGTGEHEDDGDRDPNEIVQRGQAGVDDSGGDPYDFSDYGSDDD
ncbi:hypothetical protein V5O48_015543 [Marasmius crinis-equi]|uniref:Uncharacterized protein n=1 Tax=Marasmius crinis-equi TaxID=585013 RepID=A0ABR3EU89_9AGAR